MTISRPPSHLLSLVLVLSMTKAWGDQTSDIFNRHGHSYTVNDKIQPSNTTYSSTLGRIVGGTDVDPTLYPFFAFLDIDKGNGEYGGCGGTLVAADVILTASHCLIDAVGITAYVNMTSDTDRSYEYKGIVTEFQQHPDFIAASYTNDVALLLLSSAIPQDVVPIILNTDSSIPMDAATVQAIGFGKTSEDGPVSNVLQIADLQVVDTTTCAANYASLNPVTESDQICASAPGKDSCSGDSGGPLFMKAVAGDDSLIQIGIVSFGEGCAREEFPGVYSRVSRFYEYIRNEICRLSQSPPEFCTVPTTEMPVESPSRPSPIIAPTVPATSQPSSDSSNSPVLLEPNVPTTEPTTIESNSVPPTAPTEAPSQMDTTPQVPVEPTSGESRSIQISRTGKAIASSSNGGDISFSVYDGQDISLGLPGGILSMEDLSISKEGFLFGLSLESHALCSFQIEPSTLTPISCIGGDWSQFPFTGISATGGFVVISGGDGGMTVALYNTSSGVIDSRLDCLNCTLDDTVERWPDVKVALSQDGIPTAILSTIWANNMAGVMFVDLHTMEVIGRIELPSFLGYALVSDVYDSPQTGIISIFLTQGDVFMYQVEGGNVSSTLEKPFDDFRSTYLSIDRLNAVMVVGGAMSDDRNALAVYDILVTDDVPQLRGAVMVEGRVLSVAANAGKIAYVTAENPSILALDPSEISVPTFATNQPSGMPLSSDVRTPVTPSPNPGTSTAASTSNTALVSSSPSSSPRNANSSAEPDAQPVQSTFSMASSKAWIVSVHSVPALTAVLMGAMLLL